MDSELGDHTPVYGWVTRQQWDPSVGAKDRYITSFWISLLDVTGDYGETKGEKIYGVAQHLVYEAFFSFLVGTFAAMAMAGQFSGRLKGEKLQRVGAYLQQQRVPMVARRRITEYYDHMFVHKPAFAEKDLLNEIPEALRSTLAHKVTLNFIKSYGFFSDFRDAVILPLCNSVRRVPAKKCDIIISRGSTAREMYLILHGCVDVYDNYAAASHHSSQYDVYDHDPNSLGLIQDGHFFGQAELMRTVTHAGASLEGPSSDLLRRRRTVVAKQECDLAVFPYDVMRTLMAEHPLFRKRLRTLDAALTAKKKTSAGACRADKRNIMVLVTGWRSLEEWQTTLQELLPSLASRGASVAIGVGIEGHHNGLPAALGDLACISGVHVRWAGRSRQRWMVTETPAQCAHEATTEDAADATNALLEASAASVAKTERLTGHRKWDTVILLSNNTGPGFTTMTDVLTDDVTCWDTKCPTYFTSSLQTLVKHAVARDGGNARGFDELRERHQIVCVGSHTQSWLPWLTKKFAAAMPSSNARKTTLNTIAVARGGQTTSKSRVVSTVNFVLYGAKRSLHGHVLSA